MSNKPEPLLKKATKEWAKDYWLITPWNLLAFGATFALAKWLCGVVGITAYGTAAGNFKLSGVLLLAAIVAAIFATLGSSLFRVKAEEKTDAFWLAGLWMLIGLGGCVTLFGRAILIAVGIIAPKQVPPAFLQWIFDPEWLERILELGG